MAVFVGLGELSSYDAGENDELYMGMIIGGTVVGILTGSIMGRGFELRRAISAIRKARKPRIFE